MPLKDKLPLIDDRRYDDIVTEIRTRVARYAPEWRPGESAWTDVNENDPGITLAQVFAWQADMLLYRLNKLPALSYLKFLELIGIELTPAAPAQAEVTLPVAAGHAEPLVRVPMRTQLTADPGDGGPPLVFETVRGMVCFRAALAVVRAYDGTRNLDVSAENAAAQPGFEPFGPRADAEAALLLAFDDAAPLPEGETLELAFAVAAPGATRQYLPCGANPLPYAPATLVWEYQDATGWRPLDVLKDETLAFTRSGHVGLRLPSAAALPKTKVDADLKSYYWLRARLARSQYEQPPRLLAVRANTVVVEQAQTLRDEVLGGSDGRRQQTFQLSGAPVVAGSLRLEIEQSDEGFEAWTEVADFYGSEPDDRHYMLNRSTGEIRTGDGRNGAIPVAYVNNPSRNVVAREYRVGGGQRGNVAAGAIKTLANRIEGIDDSGVANLLPAHGGRDEESLEEAKKRAPRSLRSRERAVTEEDYETLAQAAGNVKRAKALPMFHPDFPTQRLPGVVSVVVVPDSADARPMPSEGTLRSVCAYLDDRRLLTTELYVLRPGYQKIEVRGRVLIGAGADRADVASAIRSMLTRYFHALTGGEDELGWPFGGKVFYARVYQRVLAVPGVTGVERLALWFEGVEQPPYADVAITPHGLLYSEEHHVAVDYEAGEATP